MAPGDRHHRRHRGHRRQGQRAPRPPHQRARHRSPPLRQTHPPARPRPQVHAPPPQRLPHRPQTSRRAHPGRRLPRRHVRQRKILRQRRQVQVSWHRRTRRPHGQVPRPQRAPRLLAGLAHHLAPHARQIRPPRRAIQQRRRRVRLQGHRRPLALRLRHDPRRVLRRARTHLGPAPAPLPGAPRLRPLQAHPEIRRRSRPSRRHDPRPPPRQHVGPGVGQHLRHRSPHRPQILRLQDVRPRSRPQKTDRHHRPRSRTRLHHHPRSHLRRLPHRRPRRRQSHGPLRRALLHLHRLRPAPRHLLAALPVHQAPRPRSRLPRLRMGRR